MRFIFIIISVMVFCLLSFLPTQGQSIQDPLKKPRVWAMIMDAPESRISWVKYMGKPWSTLSEKEKKQIEVWKNKIQNLVDEANNAAIINTDEDVFAGFDNTEAAKAHKEVVEKEELNKATFFASYEKAMIEESQLLVGLKRNIIANFIIIDDTYREEFEAIGIAYQTYDKVHPENKYNKETWVVEKEKELIEFKKKQLEELKKSMEASEE